ncbi:RING finger protein 11, partial [Baffinella frigidus]
GDGTCVICQSEFCAQEEAKRLPCLHTFHVECIDRWLARANTCPICVHPVD